MLPWGFVFQGGGRGTSRPKPTLQPVRDRCLNPSRHCCSFAPEDAFLVRSSRRSRIALSNIADTSCRGTDPSVGVEAIPADNDPRPQYPHCRPPAVLVRPRL